MTRRSKKYRNPVHRSLHDYNWMGDDDGYEYAGPRRFRRNTIDGVFGGVCAGVGDYIDMDPTLVRIIFVLSVIFLGFPVIIYFLFWIFTPSDKRAPYVREYRQARRAEKRRRKHPEEEAPIVRTTTFRDTKSKFRSLEVRLQDLERSITSKEWQLRRQFRDLE